MRKKTYTEKARAGTLKLETLRDSKLNVTSQPPKPQTYLIGTGKKIYHEICEHIINHNVLCDIDSFNVSTLAYNFDLFARMARLINVRERKTTGSGLFFKTKTGYMQKSVEAQAMDTALGWIMKLSKEYGLTVSARDSILAFSKDSTEDEDEEELQLD